MFEYFIDCKRFKKYKTEKIFNDNSQITILKNHVTLFICSPKHYNISVFFLLNNYADSGQIRFNLCTLLNVQGCF